MKSIALLFLSFFLLSSAQSQNILCKKFGSSYAEVKSFFETHEAYDVTHDSGDQLVAATDILMISYHFHGEKLYKIEMVKFFDDKKQASATLSALKDYYEKTGAEIADNCMTKKCEDFLAVRKDAMTEVKRSETESQYEVSFTSVSFRHDPAYAGKNPESFQVYGFTPGNK